MSDINVININFRSKFSKHILSDIEREVLVSAFKKFVNFEKDAAINMLWQLTITPKSEVLLEIGLAPETISPEMDSVLRTELRYQYDVHHSNFLAVELPEVCREAFSLFENHTNKVIAYVVYTHCTSFLFLDESSITRALFLLNSDKENQYFGGLRSLNFNIEEAEFLKIYHQEVHALLKALYEFRKSQGAYTTSNTPFANLDEMIQKTGNDLPFTLCTEEQPNSAEKMLVDEVHDRSLPKEIPTESPVQEPLPEIAVFNAITAENILAHKDVFSAFAINRDMSCLVELSKLGFDLNEVVAKEMEITNFIQAAETLSE